MNTTDAGDGALPITAAYELVYAPIHGGCGYAFPCNESGAVELNALGQRARGNYLLARTLVGRDFYAPTVRRAPGPAAG